MSEISSHRICPILFIQQQVTRSSPSSRAAVTQGYQGLKTFGNHFRSCLPCLTMNMEHICRRITGPQHSIGISVSKLFQDNLRKQSECQGSENALLGSNQQILDFKVLGKKLDILRENTQEQCFSSDSGDKARHHEERWAMMALIANDIDKIDHK